MLTNIKDSFHCCHDIQKQHGCKVKNKYEFSFDFYHEMQKQLRCTIFGNPVWIYKSTSTTTSLQNSKQHRCLKILFAFLVMKVHMLRTNKSSLCYLEIPNNLFGSYEKLDINITTKKALAVLRTNKSSLLIAGTKYQIH